MEELQDAIEDAQYVNAMSDEVSCWDGLENGPTLFLDGC